MVLETNNPPIKNTLEETIRIRYSDIDLNSCLKPSSLFNFFQDIATDSANGLGFGYSYLYPKDLIWVLLKYRIEFREYPTDIQNLRLITDPRGYHKLFAYRNFDLIAHDRSIVKASSLWGLLNLKTRNMVSIEEALDGNQFFRRYEPNETDLSFGKIPNSITSDFKEEFTVRYNDIDINMHANNSNYITWGLEPLPYEFRVKNKLKSIDMLFKKEIKLKEKLISCVQLQDKTSIHILKNLKDEDLCLIKCEWT